MPYLTTVANEPDTLRLVMDLNGQIFLKPSFEEVKQKIGSP